MTKIWIDHEQCKGCGLCTTACPKQILKLSNHRFNQKDVYDYLSRLCHFIKRSSTNKQLGGTYGTKIFNERE